MTEKSFIPWKWSGKPQVPDIDLPSLEELQHNLNQFFETMWDKIGKQHQAVSGRASQSPISDMGESGDMLEIMIELPGVSEDDIEIQVSEDSISISAEKKFEQDRAEWNYHVNERFYGRFRRIYGLPEDADGSKTRAHLENGVLTIAVPKKPGTRKPVKSVPITAKPQAKAKSKTKAKAKPKAK